jgi:hypothetical protein
LRFRRPGYEGMSDFLVALTRGWNLRKNPFAP